MSNTLKLLHPFMPYITEEIWQTLPHEGEALIVSKWPEYTEELNFAAASEDMEKVMALIRAVRARRADMNVPPSKKAHLSIETNNEECFKSAKDAIMKLAYASDVETGASFNLEGSVAVVTDSCKAYMPMSELVDKTAEIARLTKELESAQKQLDNVNAKLNNETFMSKAPEKVVAGVRDNGEKLTEKIRLIKESLEAFK